MPGGHPSRGGQGRSARPLRKPRGHRRSPWRAGAERAGTWATELARLQPLPPAPGALGAGGAVGARAEGKGADPRPPLPSIQSFSQLRSLRASCGGGRRALAGRPATGRLAVEGSGKTRVGPRRRRDPASRKGPGRSALGSQGPGEPSPAGAPREGAAVGAAGRGRPRGRAGPPGVSLGADAGRGRLLPGSPRLSRARPGRPLLTQGAGEQREQCRERQTAAAAGRRPHPGGGAARPVRTRGRETRGERSCAAAAAAPAAAADPPPPAPLFPPPAPRRLRTRPLAASIGSARLARGRGAGRGGRSSAGTAPSFQASDLCSLRSPPLLFLPLPHLGPILCLRALPPYSITSLSVVASKSLVPLLIPRVKRLWGGGAGGGNGRQRKENHFSSLLMYHLLY